MAQPIDKLNRAKELKNDEFYTYYNDVENLSNATDFLTYIKFNKLIVYCPFSSNESNFVKFFINNKIDVNYGLDYANMIYCKNAIVIDNPPFSKLQEIINFYMEHNIKFILFAPLLIITKSYFLKYFNLGKIDITNFYNQKLSFTNTQTKVNCCAITNIKYCYINQFYTKTKIKTPVINWYEASTKLTWQLNHWTAMENINYSKAYILSHFFTSAFHHTNLTEHYLTTRGHAQEKIFNRFIWKRKRPQYNIIIKGDQNE